MEAVRRLPIQCWWPLRARRVRRLQPIATLVRQSPSVSSQQRCHSRGAVMMRSIFLRVLLGTTAVLAVPAFAWAADAPNGASNDTTRVAAADTTQVAANLSPLGGEQTVETVVVTARRRAENSQDVPISLQAISGETLERKGTIDLQSLIAQTPGLNSTGGNPRNFSVLIRGHRLCAHRRRRPRQRDRRLYRRSLPGPSGTGAPRSCRCRQLRNIARPARHIVRAQRRGRRAEHHHQQAQLHAQRIFRGCRPAITVSSRVKRSSRVRSPTISPIAL